MKALSERDLLLKIQSNFVTAVIQNVSCPPGWWMPCVPTSRYGTIIFYRKTRNSYAKRIRRELGVTSPMLINDKYVMGDKLQSIRFQQLRFVLLLAYRSIGYRFYTVSLPCPLNPYFTYVLSWSNMIQFISPSSTRIWCKWNLYFHLFLYLPRALFTIGAYLYIT
jgi:hypothetical protein